MIWYCESYANKQVISAYTKKGCTFRAIGYELIMYMNKPHHKSNQYVQNICMKLNKVSKGSMHSFHFSLKLEFNHVPHITIK